MQNSLQKSFQFIFLEITKLKIKSFECHKLEGIASICFRFHFQQTLRMHTQGCQGCQKIRNFVRNSKYLSPGQPFSPKLNKIKNYLPFVMNFDSFLNVFLILLNFGMMVDLAMSIFVFLIKFLFFWHPWQPWVCIRSDFKPQIETDISNSSYCASDFTKKLSSKNLMRLYEYFEIRKKVTGELGMCSAP